MNMDTATQSGSTVERKPGSKASWIILALWFAWLAALMIMSYPEWGKSKRDLLEPADRPVQKPVQQTGTQEK
jgi:hypothetical protein